MKDSLMLTDMKLTLANLNDAYEKGASPSDVVREVYRRIEAVNDPALFIHLRPMEDVLADTENLPEREKGLALWGIPFVAKDNIDVGGIPTTAGCPDYAYTPEQDAFVVGLLREAGALVIGKTNLDQFATGLVGVRSPHGVPRNAIDPEIVPGGSSSGSATAVGHGIVSFSLGTDTAGSGRVPAALNGIVGLKPSLGALSATGVVPACRTLDTISIFAMNVSDAFNVFQVTCVFDPEDAYSKTIVTGDMEHTPPTVKVGVPNQASRKFFGDDVQAARFEEDLTRLIRLGAEVIELDFSVLYEVADLLYEGAWIAERYTVIEELLKTKPEAVHPTTAKVIGSAEGISAADTFRGMYRLKRLKREAKELLKQVDLLCVPTIPTFYSIADLEADPITPNSNLGAYTNFVNLLDMAGLSVPSGPRTDGRPGSITLLGDSGTDAKLASFAQLFETGRRLDNAAKGGVKPDEITLAVCGAHMSGMALNHELTDRGGRFLEATHTAAKYQLYALAGGPPERPGLLRVQDGATIELEVWSLPKDAFGDFMAGIPCPLSIGTIELADGTTSHGFLVEAEGIIGASDITNLGSWRAYVSQRKTQMAAG